MGKPNIVMLVMDTARAKNFSCYGYEKKTSPFIDSVAKEGMIFENCYANAPWTLPSHYSMFTGEDPTKHDYNSKDMRGRIEKETVSEKLSEKGYQTIGISNNGYISPLYGFDQYFDKFHFNAESAAIESMLLFEEDEIFMEMLEGEREDRWNSTSEKYRDFLLRTISEKSVKSLINGAYYLFNQKILSGKDSVDDGARKSNEIALEEVKNIEKPYFLFINYVEAHTPYEPPEEYAEKFLDEEEIEEAKKAAETDSIVKLRERRERDHEAELIEDLYNAEIRYLDDRIKELIENLEELDEDTIFLILSDHGEYFGEHRLWEHMARLDEEVLKVPFVVKNAGKGSESEFFGLNNIQDYMLNLSEGKNDWESGSFVSYYEGLESHQWSIETEDFPEEFLNPQIYYGENGEVNYFQSKNFDKIPDTSLKNRLTRDNLIEDIDF